MRELKEIELIINELIFRSKFVSDLSIKTVLKDTPDTLFMTYDNFDISKVSYVEISYTGKSFKEHVTLTSDFFLFKL